MPGLPNEFQLPTEFAYSQEKVSQDPLLESDEPVQIYPRRAQRTIHLPDGVRLLKSRPERYYDALNYVALPPLTPAMGLLPKLPQITRRSPHRWQLDHQLPFENEPPFKEIFFQWFCYAIDHGIL